MKSEPDELSIDDLEQKGRWYWDGVRNYEARNFMRDDMRPKDRIIFYHSNAAPSGPAGVAEVASLPYPDFTQFDQKSKYFDPKSTPTKPRWFMVDVQFIKKFPRTIARDELRANPTLQHMHLWSRPRLSITPLSREEFTIITRLAKKPSPYNKSG